jgi:hypothetical protein
MALVMENEFMKVHDKQNEAWKLVKKDFAIRLKARAQGDALLKRVDLMEFLKEVLCVCGESIIMEMIWLNKPESLIGTEDEDYQLVIKSSSGLSGQECFNQIIEKYRLKMEKQGDLWVFSRNENATK